MTTQKSPSKKKSIFGRIRQKIKRTIFKKKDESDCSISKSTGDLTNDYTPEPKRRNDISNSVGNLLDIQPSINFKEELNKKLIARGGLGSPTIRQSTDNNSVSRLSSTADEDVTVDSASKNTGNEINGNHLIKACRAKSALNMQRQRKLPSKLTPSVLPGQCEEEEKKERGENASPDDREVNKTSSQSLMNQVKLDKSPQFKGKPTPRSRTKSREMADEKMTEEKQESSGGHLNTTQELLSNVSFTTDSSIGSIYMANESFSLHSPQKSNLNNIFNANNPASSNKSTPSIRTSIERSHTTITPLKVTLKPVPKDKLTTEKKNSPPIAEEVPEILNLKAGLKPVALRKNVVRANGDSVAASRPISMFVCGNASKSSNFLEEIARKRNELGTRQRKHSNSEINNNNMSFDSAKKFNLTEIENEPISERIKMLNERISQNSSGSSKTCSQSSLQAIDPPSISKGTYSKPFNVFDDQNDRENQPIIQSVSRDHSTEDDLSASVAMRASRFGKMVTSNKSLNGAICDSTNTSASPIVTNGLKKRRGSLKASPNLVSGQIPLKESNNTQQNIVTEPTDSFKTTIVRRNCRNQIKDIDPNNSVRASRVFELVKNFQNLS